MKRLIVPVQGLLLIGASVILTSMSAPVFAEGVLEEIVVTAQFREEKLQDTPIAITAVSDEMMRARSADTIFQATQYSPNVQLKPAPGPFGSSLNAFIRGIGQDDFEFAREPGVGMYIDDVYFPTLTGSIFEVLDLERVEVLRGPQGTLAGRNSIGGAVRLITKKPTGEGSGYAELTYGEYNRIGGKAGAEFTILPDQLYARISGMFNFKDGFQDRVDFACANPIAAAAMNIPSSTLGTGNCKLGTLGGQSIGGGRAQLRWTPTDRLDINIAADLTQDTSEPPAQTLIGVSAGAGAAILAATGSTYDPRFVPNDIYTTYETFANTDVTTNAPVFPPGPPTAGTSSTSLTGPWAPPIENYLQTWGIAGTIDYQINDKMSAKVLVSHRELDNTFPTSTDGSPLPLETGYNHPFGDSLQVEGRLNASLFDDRLDSTVGVFWFEQDNRDSARIDIPYAGGTTFIFDFLTDQTYESESLGIYGHGVFHITDRFNLTGGIRYSDEEKFQSYKRLDPATGGTTGSNILAFCAPIPAAFQVYPQPGVPIDPANPPTCVDPNTGYAGENTFTTSRIDYRVSLDYRWSDQLMTYVTHSTGFKSGGVSPRFFFLTHITPYDEEQVRAYEVGFKADLFDDRLRVNAAGFLNKYDDQQVGQPVCPDLVPQSPCLADRNLLDSDIYGAEFEGTFAPTDQLTIDASLSWIQMDFTFIDTTVAGPGFQSGASTPEQTPEWKFNIGAQYEFSMGEMGTLTPRFDVNWEDKTQGFGATGAIGFDPTVPIPVDSRTLVNARLTWRSADEDWEAAFAVTNLTDEEYYYNQFDISAFGGWASANTAPPREWALTLRRNF